jgi:hypothetical protein
LSFSVTRAGLIEKRHPLALWARERGMEYLLNHVPARWIHGTCREHTTSGVTVIGSGIEGMLGQPLTAGATLCCRALSGPAAVVMTPFVAAVETLAWQLVRRPNVPETL